MTTEIVEISSCKKNLSVQIPEPEVDQEIERIAREYARGIKVPGFRPGKVPLNIIKQRYAGELRKEAAQSIIERCWDEAIREHKLKPLAEPVVEKVENTPGSPLKFVIAFEVLPEVEAKDYKGVSITMPPIEVSEDDVNRALEELHDYHAQFVPLEEGEAQDGHQITVTLEGRFEDSGKTMREENVTLILGHPRTNSEFSRNLLGSKVGEIRTFEIHYPDNYHRKNFAGKKVQYSVHIKEIKEKQLPELNDDFAKDIGSENLESLRAQVRNDLVTRAKQDAEKKAREELLDIVVRRQNTIEVPECMLQKELEVRINQIARNLAYQGVDINQASFDWKKIIDNERPGAEQSVRQAIILDAIARQEGIEVTQEEVDLELQKLCEGTKRSVAALRAQLEKDEQIKAFEQRLRRNKALDFVYCNANIT